MATPTRVDRLFDVVNGGSDAIYDAVRNNNERMLRFSRIVVEEMHRTQRENSDLVRQWMKRPADVMGFSNSVLETWTRRGRRRLELTRTVMEDVAMLAPETREVVQRVTDVNREAARATVAAGREAARATVAAGREAMSRAGEEVSERARDISRAAEDVSRNAAEEAEASRRRNAEDAEKAGRGRNGRPEKKS